MHEAIQTFGLPECRGDLLDPNTLEIVDLAAEWPRILSVIRTDCEFETLMVWGLADATKGRFSEDSIWTKKGAPWRWGRTDYWVVENERRIDQEEDDWEIVAARELDHALYGALEGGIISEIQTADLLERTDAILDRLRPQPDSLDWFRSIAHCHWIAPATLRLAELAWPDGKWMLLIGDMHSCVVDPFAGKVVDLLWREEHVHPVAHAQVKDPWPSYEVWDAADRALHCLPPDVRNPAGTRAAQLLGLQPACAWPEFDVLRPDVKKLWMEKTLELAADLEVFGAMFE